MKFGFPMAASATMLAWGVVDYRSAVRTGGPARRRLLDNIEWATDYFIKAHSAPNELYGQIGAGGADHGFWGAGGGHAARTVRRSFKIDASCGGSDLAAETAAALAASSIVFRPTNAAYANTLVRHARQLFTFADTVTSRASTWTASPTPPASTTVASSGLNDELVVGSGRGSTGRPARPRS